MLVFILASVIRKLLSMFGTIWVCEHTFSTAKFMKSKFTKCFWQKFKIQIEMYCKCKIYARFSRSYIKKNLQYLIINFTLALMLKWYFDVLN